MGWSGGPGWLLFHVRCLGKHGRKAGLSQTVEWSTYMRSLQQKGLRVLELPTQLLRAPIESIRRGQVQSKASYKLALQGPEHLFHCVLLM